MLIFDISHWNLTGFWISHWIGVSCPALQLKIIPDRHRQRPTKLDFSGASVAEMASPSYETFPKPSHGWVIGSCLQFLLDPPNLGLLSRNVAEKIWLKMKIWWWHSQFADDPSSFHVISLLGPAATRWSLHVGYLGRRLGWLAAPEAAPL